MSDRIQLFQLDRLWTKVGNEILDIATTEMHKGVAQNGLFVSLLEQRIANYFDRKYCITTGSCSDALYLGIRALNLPPHSRIAVSNYTFVASAHAIARAGHIVVPIDVNKNYCMNTDLIEDCAAAVAVDIFGNMSNIPNIPTVVDAAQSFESKNDTKSGSRGKIACLSFAPTKTIPSWGSGGAILTDDDDIAFDCYRLRLHGKLTNSHVAVDVGINSMLSSFEAAAIWVGMDHMHEWNLRRKQIAEYLVKESNHECSLDFTQAKHTYSKLVFTNNHVAAIIDKMNKSNIEATNTYRRLISDETLYKQSKSFPYSEKLRDTSFTVPNQHTLTDDEVERIAKALR